MVSSEQRRNIKQLMAEIKEAKNKGMHKREIERRTQKLINYLNEEGIIDPFE